MKYAVDSSEMKIYDRNTSEYFGVPSEVLMERASLKVVDNILVWVNERNADRRYKALILCGVGNNGGDGACIARLLRQKGIKVCVCVIGDYTKCSSLLLKQLDILKKYGVLVDTFSHIRDTKSPAEFDIIVDAIFGIGLTRAIAGDYAEAVNYCNDAKKERQSDLFVVSVDMPSGVNTDNGEICGVAVNADLTVTFNFAKLGHLLYPGCENAGQLVIEDVGITDDSFLGKEPRAFYYDEDDLKSLIPSRKKDGNKGTNGKILIVAGSKDISGACILAAKAAIKAGAGMIRVFTATENSKVVRSLLPEAMIDTYTEDEDFAPKLSLLMDWSTAAVIGPGIGTGRTACRIVRQFLDEYSKDLVADADALNIIASDENLKKMASNYARNGKKLILTPHLGEFARLSGYSISECKSNILEYPRNLAKELHCTIVCKDARTVVADSNEKKIYINMSGNDGMATAGSGDVLAGTIGALTAFDISSFELGCLGSYLHGKAGDKASWRLGKSAMTASDIIESLGDFLE